MSLDQRVDRKSSLCVACLGGGATCCYLQWHVLLICILIDIVLVRATLCVR